MRKCSIILLLFLFLVGCTEYLSQDDRHLPLIQSNDLGHSFVYKGKVYVAQALLGVPESQLGEPIGRLKSENMVVYRIKGLSEEWLATVFEGTPTVYTSKKGISLKVLSPNKILIEDTTPILSLFTDETSIKNQKVIDQIVNKITMGKFSKGEVKGKIRKVRQLSFVSSRYPGIRYMMYYTEVSSGQAYLDDNTGRLYPHIGSILKPYLQ
ncbi:hypothetical protein [Polycladomyces subterraneus]|uniref:Lipoprotein n=1 Tax=Polycladomyces subterraneus TaxID=1016997 RepID=A0ABT8IS48_9BACL|nr:hypothetical protein [Polycladomyces subterraneus]MDN4595202.1 hypothetical protein [Polycladomyces subterraneus]